MDQTHLKALLRGREGRHVDFKIECHAFAGHEGHKAELVKDIVAMANYGNRLSYLIIGVCNDGRRFRSVQNTKLTDDSEPGLPGTAQ